MSKSKPALRRWRITLIRHKGERIGPVEASDAETAIKLAIEHYAITDPHRQQRPAARP